MNKNVISIMGTGPLGLWTAAALESELKSSDFHIRMGNRRGQAPAWVPENVRTAMKNGCLSWHEIDALNAESIRNFADGSSVLIHTVVPQYHEWVEQLPIIQQHVNDAALATKARLICADNLYVYAPPVSGPLTEDSERNPPSEKGQVRLDLHIMLRKARVEHGLVWSTLQASQYFGPGATRQSVFGDRFIDPLLQGKTVQFLGNPTLRHSWAYAPDIGRAMALLAMTPHSKLLNRSWIIPHVSHLPSQDLAQLFIAELNCQGIISTRKPQTGVITPSMLRQLGSDNPVLKAREEILYQFLMDFEASGDQFIAATGFVPTPLEQAIAKTIAYWKVTKFK
ncbi:nucleoside-diphosphate-sugar epimerase [Neobacillus niacini]|uniref:NAD-dependent epimerase/dehydratase family protein n=1 Tax=Neobacillus niacini TaxID=86668 RepID=UPI002861C7BE|nr:NAD-dependent epimerase/dehydratase family protein [Neobacillus niacini]MDR7076048.1 nucleoside-diphosphate-sugar epimerase [Neobacillus niacini]